MPLARLLAAFALAGLALHTGVPAGAATVASWSPTGALTAPRTGQVVVLLRDGRLLAVGGSDGAAAIASAELFDPATGTWSAALPMAAAREGHTATLLATGKVLVAGGRAGGTALDSAELFDPAAGTWAATDPLDSARADHTATLLPDGRVLVAGGTGAGTLNTAEVYDPSTQTWGDGGTLTAARALHTATLLQDGRVLVAGGSDGGAPLASAELFEAGALPPWTATAMTMASSRDRHTATLLPNGKVLVAGGESGVFLAGAELFDPAGGGTWTSTGALLAARRSHAAVLLSTGKVLVLGGYGYPTTSCVAAITGGAIVNGALATTDCRSVPRGTSYYADSYRFQGQAGDAISIQLTSAQFNSYLYLLDASDVVVAQDDNGGGGTNSRIPAGSGTFTLPAAGHYAIEATSSFTGQTGSYTLTLTGPVTNPGPPEPLMTAEVYDPASGLWSATASLGSRRQGHTASLLPGGRVLAVAGAGQSGVLASTEMYEPDGGAWAVGTPLNTGRSGHRATLLPSGKVLVVGGFGSDSSSELYDPSNPSWTYTGSISPGRSSHTLTLLPSGNVLVAGGDGPIDSNGLKGAQLYDAGTGGWAVTGSMTTGRASHTATLLADGRVLVAGGVETGVGTTGAVYTNTAEIYDSATGAFTETADMSAARGQHTATLLQDGRVLVVGGWGPTDDCCALAGAEIWDPGSGNWTPAPPLPVAARSDHTATLLPSGRVLVVGGNPGGVFNALATVEVYDPVAVSWSEATPLTISRWAHTATLLPDGNVLVTGGGTGSATSGRKSSVLYVPAVNAWKVLPDLPIERAFHTATLLPDGRLLVAGGDATFGDDTGVTIYDDGLDPASRRPVITASPSGLPGGLPFSVTGTAFRGDSEASGGTTSSASAAAPLVQLLSLESARQTFIVPDAGDDFWDEPMTLFFADAPTGLDLGWHLLTVMRGGVASASRTVEVQSCDITVSQQPLSQTVAVGATATFTVAATGGRNYQWLKDGVVIPGATQRTYTTPPIAGADSGTTYRCRIGGSCSTLLSDPAVITVADAIPPAAAVVTPSGGEYWLLSQSGQPPNTRVVTWSMSDNVRVCQVRAELLYSNDAGVNYFPVAPDGGLPATFGPGGTCPNPGVGTTSVTYTVPTTFPSEVTGSLYKIEVVVTDHAGLVTTVRSPSPFYIVQGNPDSVRTLILANLPRMQSVMGISGAQAAAVSGKLADLANHPRVLGLVVDLGATTSVTELLAAWDANVANPDRANAVLFGCHSPYPPGCAAVTRDGIHDIVRSLLAIYSGVRHLIVVGDDRIIPLARIADRTVLLPESTYATSAPGADLTDTGTTVGRALAVNKYLSDDPLAIADAVRPDDLSGNLFIPDLAVGRLVETPEEITTAIAAFISQDGVLDLSLLDPVIGHKVLVTGYDFLIDTGKKVRSRWKNALGVSTPDNSLFPVDGSLISGSWSLGTVADRAAALRAHLGGNGGDRYGVMNLNGHATHFEEGVPGTNPFDIQGLPSRDIYGSDACASPGQGALGLAGGIVYSVGCHGGLPVSGSCATDDDHSLDLPQTFLSRGVVAYVANTGYGWGLQSGIGYGERLTELFTEELTQGGTITVGDAVRRSKQRYFLETPRYDVYDEKSLMQWTVFGLPMYAVKTGIATNRTEATETRRHGDTERNVRTEEYGNVRVNEEPPPPPVTLPAYLTQLNLHFDFTAPGVYTKRSASGDELPATPGCPAPAPGEPEGCYYTLNGLVERSTGAGDLPVQPYFIYDSRLSGTSQHGVIWKGGTYQEETGWVPVVGTLVSNGGDSSDHGSTPRIAIIKAVTTRVVPGQDPAACRPSDLEVNSLVVPAGEALKPNDADPTYSIERTYRGIDLEVFYFNNTLDGAGNCDREGPGIGIGPHHTTAANVVSWSIEATDPSGVWRVLVVTSDGLVDGQGQGSWVPLDLTYDSGTDRWVGGRSFAGTTRVTYVVQAVDNRGNVTWLDYAPAQLPASGVNPGVAAPVDVTVSGSGPPPGLSVGDVTVVEGTGGGTVAAFVVTLTPSSGAAVLVDYALSDGSASAGTDYLASAGTVGFSPGTTTRTVSVTVLSDAAVEGNETFTLSLSNPSGATLADATGTATIVNDDTYGPQDARVGLSHGSALVADLSSLAGPVASTAWYRITQEPYASYEVVVDAVSGDLQPASLARTSASGAVVQAGAGVGTGRPVSVRWQTGPAPATDERIRLSSGGCTTTCGADDVYRLRAYETTYTIPRFNTSGGQVTVLVLQNPTDQTASGTAYFWSAAGALLGSAPFSLAAHGALSLNGSTVGGVAGQSGTVTVTSDAPYGTLFGKTVALDPATGFSFDTPMALRRR